ncbi:MAG: alanine racemase [Acidobacteriia bacterium]|nr:alanine racemase [Terriglobia bacterium]
MQTPIQFLRRLPVEASPAWAEISLSRILKNLRAVQRRTGKTCELMAVVKANAYGHGAAIVSPYLAAHGVRWFGVATIEEALELRRVGIRENVLILGTFFPPQASSAIKHHIQVTASSPQHLDALNRAASRKTPAMVHLKFDTGMGRMGFSLADAGFLAQRWARGSWPHLSLQGVSSHLASAEDLDCPQNRMQLQNFGRILEVFETAGIKIPLRHLANSAGAAFHPAMRMDLVRTGIALFGYEPQGAKIPPMGTAPVLSLKTRILHLKTVPRGSLLGYGGTFVTRRPSVIATLPIGYAHGVHRRLSFANRRPHRRANAQARPMDTIVRGQLAPMVGRVSMDLTLVDVTDVRGVRLGDEVILLGRSGPHDINAADWAEYVGTISYEVLCGISTRRVYRVYVD